MATFIFLLAMITHLNFGNGISITQKSLAPDLTVTPSSNSIQVAWLKLSSWSSSSIFVVSISTPEMLITNDVLCDGGPGTTCVFNSGDFNVMLPACTPVVVTVEASGLVLGPHITTTLSPDPLHLSVDANDRNLFINWELPAACEKSSKLIIRAKDVIVHEEVLSIPQSSYTYELSDDISYSDVIEVLVKTVDSERESRGIEYTFMYAEPRAVSISLKAYQTSVDVIFIRGYPWNSVTNFTLTIKSGTTNDGDELCSQQPFNCDAVFPQLCNINSADYCDPLPDCSNVFVEVNGIDSDTTSDTIKTICGTDTTTTIPSTESSSTPEISMTSTTITAPTITHTTTITPISSTTTTTEPTTASPQPTTSEMTTLETTTSENTTPATTTPTTTLPTTTTPTTTLPPTTISTTTITTTVEPSDPDVAVSTTSDAVYVTWYRNGPWSDVDTFYITITDANDINTELCSAEDECDEPQCTFESQAMCPEHVLTSCSQVSVTVTGGDSPQPAVSAQIAPQSPSEMSLNLTGTVVDLQWIMPDSCETGSRVSINVADESVDEVFPKTTNTYSYTFSGNLDCDVGQATVTSIGVDGESEGITEEFLLTDKTSIWAHIDSESTIEVTWSKPSCVKRTTVAWYDESEDSLIGSKEVNNQYSFEITDIGNYDVVLVCVTPKARGTFSTWVDGEKQCTIASDTTPAPSTTTSTTSKPTTTISVTTTTTTTAAVTTDTSEGTETDNGTTESNVTDPPDHTALIIGLSVGIPVALLAIAGIVYIIKKKVTGNAVTLEMTSQK